MSEATDTKRPQWIRQAVDFGALIAFMIFIVWDLAKRSNAEDFVKGHFWESRFKSQALLDEAAAIACMAYVDLNPIRAGITQTIEDSAHTSIKKRLVQLNEKQLNEAVDSISGSIHERTLSIRLKDYIELVEWTGKHIVHPGKAQIPAHLNSVFERLSLNQKEWLHQLNGYGSRYYRAVGALEAMKEKAKQLNQQWIKGIRAIKSLYLCPE